MAGKPIVYQAAPGEAVSIRGSEVFKPTWTAVRDHDGVVKTVIDSKKMFGPHRYRGLIDIAVFGDCNFFARNFNRQKVVRPFTPGTATSSPDETSGGASTVVNGEPVRDAERIPTTLGQLFLDGAPLIEVETFRELHELAGTWLVDADGKTVYLHTPAGAPLNKRLLEISVRHTIFSPLMRGLGHIHVRGFTIEHGCNHFPTWGENAWAQVGLLSTRSGHHWQVEDCTVRYAKGLGIDCGSEGGTTEQMEQRGSTAPMPHTAESFAQAGWHMFRNNRICDNGHCGIAGIGHVGTHILGNLIERNNRTGYTSPWWEFAGIKFHFFVDGLIEGNLIRDNDCHGIWIDNHWRGSRITRNVIVNNLWSGVNVELGRGPVMIDTNVIAYTRHGDGVYGHDVADVTIAHNLIYANSNHGVWFCYATPRVKAEDGCWDIKTFNDLILGNRVSAIGYSLPWHCAGNNVSDGNLFMGGGDALDEGSGARPTLFHINNLTHCAQYKDYSHTPEPLTAEIVAQMLTAALDRAGVPAAERPNPATWTDHFLVNLKLWRATTGNDTHSAQMLKINRDVLASRMVQWHCRIDETLNEVTCARIPGIDRDWRGQPLPVKPLPGPFQDLRVGQCDRTLWPVPGMRTTHLLT